jgi:hypothetical protein
MAKRGRPSKIDKAVYNKGESAVVKGAVPYIDTECNFNRLGAYQNAKLALSQLIDAVSKYKGSVEYEKKMGQPVQVISGFAMDCALASIACQKSIDAYVEIGIQLASARDVTRKEFYKQGYIEKTKPALDDLMDDAETLKGKLTAYRKNKIIGKLKNLRSAVARAGEEYADNAECATKTFLRELEDYSESLRVFIDEGVRLGKIIKELDGTASKLGVKYTVDYCKTLLKQQTTAAKVMRQQVSFQKGLQELGDAVKG